MFKSVIYDTSIRLTKAQRAAADVEVGDEIAIGSGDTVYVGTVRKAGRATVRSANSSNSAIVVTESGEVSVSV